MKRLFVIGDSTVCLFNDSTYFYPRYGYGTQLEKYLNDFEVINLALSGRSSKSFKLEENYQILINSLQEGDYLLIGFGHNDEKYDDPIRFSSASLDIENSNSFMYQLNEYLLLANSKGAIPILCTPITRYNDNNQYNINCHKTKYGDYREAIINLGKLKNVEVIDLTLYSVNLYNKLKEDAIYFHAVPIGKKDNNKLICDFSSVDKTHINILGASYYAYYIVTNSKLLNPYFNNKKAPTKELDLIMNPKYKYVEYTIPNLNNLEYKYKDWYYTIFGDIGTTIDKAGFIFEDLGDSFIMGQVGSLCGKICLTMEGYSFLFKKLSIEDNFILEANFDILEAKGLKDDSFGLMVRDDCYLNQKSEKELHLSNYVAAGMLGLQSTSHVIFSRTGFSELNKGNNIYNSKFRINDKCYAKIERLGQRISCDFIINDNKYHNDFYDFDLTKVDNKNMYIGVFVTKGTKIKVSNLSLKMTGKALGA